MPLDTEVFVDKQPTTQLPTAEEGGKKKKGKKRQK